MDFFPENNIEIPKGTPTSEDSNNEYEEKDLPTDDNEWSKVTKKEKKRIPQKKTKEALNPT